MIEGIARPSTRVVRRTALDTVATYVRMTPRPRRPVDELEGALQRGNPQATRICGHRPGCSSACLLRVIAGLGATVLRRGEQRLIAA